MNINFARVVVPGLFALASTVPSLAVADVYRFTDLGAAGSDSFGYNINNAGQVVGSSVGGATVWNGSTPTYLGSGMAFDINESGQVVGVSLGQATLWNGGTPTYLGDGRASGINDAGQVVGTSAGLRATQWNGTTPSYLASGAQFSQALEINNAGQAVGWSLERGPSPSGDYYGNLWEDGSTRRLFHVGSGVEPMGDLSDINEAEQVVGWVYYPDGGPVGYARGATLWQDGTQVQLDGLDGARESRASGINSGGDIVGESTLPGGAQGELRVATLWTGGVATDLNSFLSVSDVSAGWHLSTASAINDHGWITGTANNTLTGERHAYLLSVSPVPEPGVLALMLAGLGAGTLARRRSRGKRGGRVVDAA